MADDGMTRFRVTLTTRGAVLLVVLGIGFVFLWTVRPVLPPLIWALIVAYILDPLVRWFANRLRVRRVFTVAFLFTLFVTVLVWAFLAMRPILMREMRDLTIAIPRIADEVQDYVLGSAPIDILGVIIDPTALRSEFGRAIRDSLSGFGRQAIPFVVRAASSVFSAVLFLVSTFYLLMDLDKMGPAIVNFLPRRWRVDVIPLLLDAERVLGNYIRGQVLLILFQTAASWIVLTAFGIRYSLILAIITGFVEIFPVIGPWSVGAIVVSVSLTQQTALFGGNSAMLAVAIAATYFVLRQLEDIFIIPNLVGKIMEMHPLLVLFSLTAGGYLAGILGVLIAVPVAAVIKVCLGFLHEKLLDEERTYVAEQRAGAQHAPEDEVLDAGGT